MSGSANRKHTPAYLWTWPGEEPKGEAPSKPIATKPAAVRPTAAKSASAGSTKPGKVTSKTATTVVPFKPSEKQAAVSTHAKANSRAPAPSTSTIDATQPAMDGQHRLPAAQLERGRKKVTKAYDFDIESWMRGAPQPAPQAVTEPSKTKASSDLGLIPDAPASGGRQKATEGGSAPSQASAASIVGALKPEQRPAQAKLDLEAASSEPQLAVAALAPRKTAAKGGQAPQRSVEEHAPTRTAFVALEAERDALARALSVAEKKLAREAEGRRDIIEVERERDELARSLAAAEKKLARLAEDLNDLKGVKREKAGLARTLTAAEQKLAQLAESRQEASSKAQSSAKEAQARVGAIEAQLAEMASTLEAERAARKEAERKAFEESARHGEEAKARKAAERQLRDATSRIESLEQKGKAGSFRREDAGDEKPLDAASVFGNMGGAEKEAGSEDAEQAFQTGPKRNSRSTISVPASKPGQRERSVLVERRSVTARRSTLLSTTRVFPTAEADDQAPPMPQIQGTLSLGSFAYRTNPEHVYQVAEARGAFDEPAETQDAEKPGVQPSASVSIARSTDQSPIEARSAITVDPLIKEAEDAIRLLRQCEGNPQSLPALNGAIDAIKQRLSGMELRARMTQVSGMG